jgi:TPR repeat protein
MAKTWIKLVTGDQAASLDGTGADSAATNALVAACLAAAAAGDNDALFDLGVAYSTGSHGAPCELIEAHKWFNLAAVSGHEEAAICRAEVSEDMTAREIAEAQRRAREWLRSTRPGIRAA